MLLVFEASSLKRACFWRFLQNILFGFKPTNNKFTFTELTMFKTFDRKVPSYYFGSMPPFAHKPFLQKR